MSRSRRKKSKSGIYHIMVRGVNKEKIFFSDLDRKVFIHKLKQFSLELNIDIYAFCLMENHIHLLIGNANTFISLFMQKLLASYVRYINTKKDRIGHLFQERFKSEIVDNDYYFKTVLRYILQNPQKAGICKMNEYKWNSYSSFLTSKSFVNTKYTISLFENKESFFRFINEINYDSCMEYELSPSEKETYSFFKIKGILNGYTISEFKKLKKNEQNEYIRRMKLSGISIRFISKVLEIGRDRIYRA